MENFEEISRQINKAKKVAFVPLINDERYIYVIGTYFKYKERELVAAVFQDKYYCLIDPKTGVVYETVTDSKQECDENATDLFFITAEEEWLNYKKECNQILREMQKKLGTKPPTYILEENDPLIPELAEKLDKEGLNR